MSIDITMLLNDLVTLVVSKVIIKFDFANKETTGFKGEEGCN